MTGHEGPGTDRHRFASAAVIAATLGALLALGCASTAGKTAPTPAPTSPSAPYRVGQSDQLTVRVLPDPPIERVVKVRPDGRFSFDLIGDVDAAGRTTDEIAADIQQRIAVYRQNPSVSIALDQPSSTAVSVLGEVNKPLVFPLERDLRVSEAIAQAGGATNLAAASRVRVIRRSGGDSVTYIANLDKIQAGDTATDLQVERGDLIFVPPASTVSAGYAIRRAIYPLEELMRTFAGPLVALAIGR
jgi:polysaccharide export outer membrane protein